MILQSSGISGQVSKETAVFDFLDTAVCGDFSVWSQKRPRYRICGYRGLVQFLGICNVKCSVLGWGFRRAIEMVPRDCFGVCDETFSVLRVVEPSLTLLCML